MPKRQTRIRQACPSEVVPLGEGGVVSAKRCKSGGARIVGLRCEQFEEELFINGESFRSVTIALVDNPDGRIDHQALCSRLTRERVCYANAGKRTG
jgi:hypothetical protein